MRALLSIFILGCGTSADTGVIAVRSEFALSDAQKAKCPKLPLFVDRIKAKLIVEGMESAPCPLTVTAAGDSLAVAGACTGIPTGKNLLFTLRWFALGPNTANEVVLAESVGRAPLESVTDNAVDIDFDPTKPNQSSLVPRTRAAAGDKSDKRDIFNCDRTGTNVCDSKVAPSGATDVDTCSNLEELCQDTLFANSVDQCPPGPRVP